MKQSTLHTMILAAGMVTLGAVFGGSTREAQAYPVIVLDEVVIGSGDCDGEYEADDSICGIVER